MHEEDLSYPGEPPLDVEKYMKYLDDVDLSEESKIKLLQNISSIMEYFVRRAWGDDSVGAPFPACDEFVKDIDKPDRP